MLTVDQQRKAQVIDDYFSRMNYYPHIPYMAIGMDVVDIAVNHTGKNNLWISTAAACVEQESGGKKLFGADWGILRVDKLPFAHLYTSEKRVKELTNHVRNGGTSNGIGLTQVTYGPYVMEMEQLGGGWKTRVQLQVGFNILNDLLNSMEYYTALEAYNDGNKWNNLLNPYDQEFAAKHAAWKIRLQ